MGALKTPGDESLAALTNTATVEASAVSPASAPSIRIALARSSVLLLCAMFKIRGIVHSLYLRARQGRDFISSIALDRHVDDLNEGSSITRTQVLDSRTS
jgi:hypothetical protein